MSDDKTITWTVDTEDAQGVVTMVPAPDPAPRTEDEMVADINIHAAYAREGYPGGKP